MTQGYVYVFTNESMPGLVKIGYTKSIPQRISELSSGSGIPTPFECYFAMKVDDCAFVEGKLHDGLDEVRRRPNREFFEIAPERVKALLEIARGEIYVGSQVPDLSTSPEDVPALPRLNLRAAGLKDGDELVFVRENSIRVTARSSNLVELDGNEVTLARATQMALEKISQKWSAGAASEYWKFGDDLLSEMIRSRDPKKAGSGFALESIFPVIAKKITDINRSTAQYASHSKIARALEEDSVARELIATASMLTRFSTPTNIASNMVAWWSQQITVNQNSFAIPFERRKRQSYEYWDTRLGPSPA